MTNFWWILRKDLLSELRGWRAWPAMLLLGIVVALMFSLQMDLLPQHKQQMLGGLLWLAVFFAGLTAVDRSFSAEREDGCWQGMQLLPVGAGVLYLAKLAVNVLALLAVECLLIPLFFGLCGLPLWPHWEAMLLIALLAAVGLAAVGTLVSGLAAGSGQSGSLLAVCVLPLVIPVLLGAAECTRLAVAGQIGEPWWRWIQLLGGFAVIFLTAGTLLFEYAIED